MHSPGLHHPGINHGYSGPQKDTKSFLVKSKDRGTDPSGRIVSRIPSKESQTGQKKTDFKTGNLAGLEVWTDRTDRGTTWTLKCPDRGSEHGTIRKATTWPL